MSNAVLKCQITIMMKKEMLEPDNFYLKVFEFAHDLLCLCGWFVSPFGRTVPC